ncbi:adenosylcobinamide-phosphate synthase CbiB [Azospirillum picis]|uniref:Cobalamin biosynthesis protein CobD n=1 Tax=Azospirillum picis TaxID=488438 RepID=A0ABU0MGK1_9PROT|nr:adenosylcobinamide-phosphate synthase CbiB [Azospirillum picis]MBP2298379.1 adenosylcobinamide-phosphate synthase [Azospirillum picis]MDQ0532572.1 adenosylcobinamide-phosphate synthase [Azospirillum picis]
MLLHPFLLATALIIEAAAGYPDPLYARFRHPVVWIGALIAQLDRALNHEHDGFAKRKAAGVLALVVVLVTVGGIAVAVAWVCRLLPFGWLLEAALASTLLAQRSLHDHVAAVAKGFRTGGLEEARKAVSMIVGRNPSTLDEPAVARAAIESLAENFSDGVVAPAFWLLVGGLPGLALYKAVNTADSMIGHRTPRHEAFGWAAARLDDLVNLPGSRLTALLLVAAAWTTGAAAARQAWASVRLDAHRHRSPNAGWPEAAMAGALDLRLGGPRVYGSIRIEDVWLGAGRTAATPADIGQALRLYRRACLLLIASSLVLAAAG